tara:strand:- start:412 stop:933 length:522 start_codon:yes stop_codon:yes gene_type:complete
VASDRIGKKAANLVAVPPFEIQTVSTDFLLKQPQVEENIMQVPLNERLMKSIRLHGITNPLLCMKEWYPLAGSQRLRAAAEIKKQYPNFTVDVIVHRFLEDYHNCFYLWPDEEFRSQAIAIWFQMQEVVFKSLYYKENEDKDGTKMTEYEDIGEQLKWNRNESGRNKEETSGN